ncbi:MAG TPA: restriction endonuclease subunit S [Burkholderiaceae bacterium]|nr:restriction endonuclease subunit S [Burkholderiaceae bacterium]
MDTDQLITEHLDLWTAAIKRRSTAGRGTSRKIELYGIKKLRELILELAVRGLLVPQNPKDEPASELLKKIAAERARLVKEGKIKQDKSLPSTSIGRAIPYIPTGWACERFGNFAVIERGGSPRPIQSYLTDQPDGLNWIKIGDTDIGGKYIVATTEKIIKEGLSKTRMVYPGDFLLTNSMSFGRPYITKIEGCIHDGWLRISPSEYLDKDFLYLLLSSPYIAKSFTDAAAGAVVQNLNSEKVREVLILLPPLAEQHRIVAKVDELMALCDQLEQQTEASLTAHQTLVETLLNTLTGAADHAQFASAWQRIAEHFDTLFSTEESIDQLKQTILQLAVMGKLVPQDPNDEPASELLKTIATEKVKLVKAGKIRKENPLPQIVAKEMPFGLLKDWCWARLGEVTNYGFCDKAEPEDVTKDTWVLELEDVEKETSKLVRKVRFSERDFKSSKNIFKAGDVIYGKLRPYLDKVLVADEDGVCTTEMIPVRAHAVITPAFLRLSMKSPRFIAYANSVTHGMNLPRVGTDKARLALIPICSQTAQQRIVAKVEELMALCDQLKARLSNAQTTQLHLADALAEQALVEA